MKLFKSCGHLGRAPWGTIKCTKAPGHPGQHSAKGLRWGDDGRIRIGGKAERPR